MSANDDERVEALALLAQLKCAWRGLAAKCKQLALQCLDRRATAEDKLALAAAQTKLDQLKVQIEEGGRLLGVDASPEVEP